MISRIFLAAAVFLISSSISVTAQNAPSAERSIARQLYRNAPAKKFADNAGNAISKMTANIQKKLNIRYLKDFRMVRDTLHSAFHSAILHERSIEHLARIVAEEPAHAAAVAEWLQTPETMKVRRSDDEPDITPEVEQDVKKFFTEMDAESEIISDRMTLLAEIQEMEQLAEQNAAVTWIMIESIYKLMNAMVLIPRGEDTLSFPSLNDSAQQEVWEAAGTKILINRMYLYRELTDDEIINYGLFLDTKPGRWYTEAVGRAMASAYTDTARELEKRIKSEEK